MARSTERFSDRVADYVSARPGYPPEIITLLADRCGLRPQAVVADIGSGTGILTRMLLDHGSPVYAVEPNAAMRAAAERDLAAYPGFTSIAGTAEATGLPDASVDLVTAAQAFHWFAPEPTRAEFARILRPGGWVALIWNDRRLSGTPFLEAYERLLQTFGTDYNAVNHTRITMDVLEHFFGGPVQTAVFPNAQTLDRAGLRARLTSSSYTPAPGAPGHAEMLAALDTMFDQHQVDGYVRVDYDARVFYGVGRNP